MHVSLLVCVITCALMLYTHWRHKLVNMQRYWLALHSPLPINPCTEDYFLRSHCPPTCTHYVHTHVYMHMYTHMCTYTCTHTCIHTCIHAHVHTHVHTHVHIHMYTHMYTRYRTYSPGIAIRLYMYVHIAGPYME